jgi:four helix bundle protein
MAGNAARNFEELHIYQRARELTNAVYSLTRGPAFQRDWGLVDQIRRAVVSIMSNIAEGIERGTSAEFVQFLYIAKGSCGEVRAQLQIAADQQYITSDERARLNDLSRRTSAMISNFTAHLQSSGYKGDKIARPARNATEAATKGKGPTKLAQPTYLHRQKDPDQDNRQEPNP